VSGETPRRHWYSGEQLWFHESWTKGFE